MIEKNEEIWNEIIQITQERYTPPKEGELTTKQFIQSMEDKTGKIIQRRTAQDLLQKMVKEGKLTVRKYGCENVYRPV
jgi:acyl CoA:acetate/3-ketoacid CoA transferase